MTKRDFDEWINDFKPTISTYAYYVDFGKVCRNVDEIANKIKVMNSLTGSKDIRTDFIQLVKSNPEVIECISILLAIRDNTIQILDGERLLTFELTKYTKNDVEELADLMEHTGLFDMISNKLTNLSDFIYGVETGLDSNARKNRGGHQMEDLLESYLDEAGVKPEKEMSSEEIESTWGIDLSPINNNGSVIKRFDFVVYQNDTVYAFETNFYKSSGSKLNETARSYKHIAEKSKKIKNFKFIWVTDGLGWLSAKANLKETFEVLDTLFSIKDLEEGALVELFEEHYIE